MEFKCWLCFFFLATSTHALYRACGSMRLLYEEGDEENILFVIIVAVLREMKTEGLPMCS